MRKSKFWDLLYLIFQVLNGAVFSLHESVLIRDQVYFKISVEGRYFSILFIFEYIDLCKKGKSRSQVINKAYEERCVPGIAHVEQRIYNWADQTFFQCYESLWCPNSRDQMGCYCSWWAKEKCETLLPGAECCKKRKEKIGRERIKESSETVSRSRLSDVASR